MFVCLAVHAPRVAQAVCIQSKETPKEMVRFIESVPKESVVDIEAQVVAAPAPITSTSQQVLAVLAHSRIGSFVRAHAVPCPRRTLSCVSPPSLL